MTSEHPKKAMNVFEKLVTTSDALVAATKGESIRRIVVGGQITSCPSFRLSPGQSLRGADQNAAIMFASDAEGAQLSTSNRIELLRLEVAPKNEPSSTIPVSKISARLNYVA